MTIRADSLRARRASAGLTRVSLWRLRRLRTECLRVQHRPAMTAEIDAVFSALSTEEAIARIEASRIANARINSMPEFLEHPQLAGRGAWRQIDSPVGRLPALIPPVRMDGVEPMMGAVPGLGDHTDALLRDIGFDDDTIGRWRRDGVI